MDDKKSKLIAKALTDAAFRAELMKNPNAAIHQATGMKVPAGLTVKVVEDSASVVHLVIPAVVKPEKGELSDAALGAVSGGAGPSTQFRMCGDSSNSRANGLCVA